MSVVKNTKTKYESMLAIKRKLDLITVVTCTA